ncbi:tRNA (adenosine(37)-N6)-threonylcarbamoyltransferase complex dimerization subunit type 1 TsaB [Nicoliella spurrieriana]|uniref:tRNA (Adenosine(37)-N6)-threonylcarbamoyltransferase complex dimerization subunit type 1 TsaB n=1 Tax=Nicoliella spurrieriana TaxID=2925830 RepID=A0A976RSK7_9LACO|nr:tRNA (adenosine(37)-N6)-threonylcarbamoyltransferase complex dimerization subunit type 1 TsaB [Nicoliella spurrieriana]UQS86995.1 tRNA (adenosine(37)-N6)-threonylcarbamoyltransferase complex dimerization subunit type 1 TsaB [Nicoliella spurrieriana]
MKVLALDASNRPLSIAVLEDQQILATTTTTIHQKHAQYLLPIIDQLMDDCGLAPDDLDRVVVAYGPGSYTGIRIATATAKVLAFTLGIKLVGVSSLQTLALNFTREGQLVNPIFDARNQNLFTGLYRIQDGKPMVVIPDQHVSLERWLAKLADYQNESIIGVADANHFKAQLPSNFTLVQNLNNLPQAANLGLFGQTLPPVQDIDTFVPNYLRLTKAEADWQKLHPEEDSNSYVEKI